MISLRKSVLVLAAAPLMMIGTAAHAADAAVVAGQGGIVPGLTDVCTNQTSVTFAGTAVVAGTNAGAYSISFSGSSDGCETTVNGQGHGSLSGANLVTNAALSGSVSYTRLAAAVTVTGSVTLGGNTESITAECEFAPTSNAPIASYALSCQAALV